MHTMLLSTRSAPPGLLLLLLLLLSLAAVHEGAGAGVPTQAKRISRQHHGNMSAAPAAPCELYWSSASMSEDGKYQIAGAFGPGGGPLRISSDFGTNWRDAATPGQIWGSLRVSSDGQIMVASAAEEYVSLSRDYGNTWSAVNPCPTGDFGPYSFYVSSTGSLQIVFCPSGVISISRTYGDSWTKAQGYPEGKGFWAVSKYHNIMNRGSQYLSASFKPYTPGATASIYISDDFGDTWTVAETPASALKSYNQLQTSSSGQFQITVARLASGAEVLMSTDYGVSFSLVPQLREKEAGDWTVALSSDGKYGVAVWGSRTSAIYLSIFTSVDFGVTWKKAAGSDTIRYDGNVLLSGSSSGQYLTLAMNSFSNPIWISSDYGETWENPFPFSSPLAQWATVTLSSSGQYQLVGGSGHLIRSVDFGRDWN